MGISGEVDRKQRRPAWGWRGGSERKQIKGEKIETTGNTQKGDRPMEELGWVGPGGLGEETV